MSSPPTGVAPSDGEGAGPASLDRLPAERRLLRSFPAKDLVAVRGANAELWDDQGRRYLDLGGASHGVALLGHNHPRIVAAVQRQAAQLIHVAQTVPTPARALMLQRLHALLPAPLQAGRTFIANSGTEAIECAVKLARARTGRNRFVAAQAGFHGRTIGALSLTHRAQFRDPFSGLLCDTAFTPFNDEEQLKAAVTRETAAVVLEPVQGEGGIRPATASYLRAARDLAHDAGALLVLDEVQSGLGRTGRMFGFEHAGIVPDVLCLAKGLAGGLAIGTCTATEHVAASLPPAAHGGTYGGNPLACAAGAEALAILSDDGLAERAARLGDRFMDGLRALGHPAIREVRGSGLMVGVELRIRPQGVLAALHRRGVLALTGGTTGVRFLPPLTVPEAHLSEATAAFGAALAEAAVPGARAGAAGAAAAAAVAP